MNHKIKFAAALCLLLLGVWIYAPSLVKNNYVSDKDDFEKSRLITDALHQKGIGDAKITVVEFSDFGCLECREAEQVVTSLNEKYNSKIKLVFRHFPLTSIHKNSLMAAIAAEAAGAQGKFWEFKSVLFDQQESWVAVGDPVELFVAYARQINMSDINKFKREVVSQTYRTEVLSDMKLGQESGVNIPPTFFVNEEKVDKEGLKLAIEKVLSKP